jgi:hypothetical protein
MIHPSDDLPSSQRDHPDQWIFVRMGMRKDHDHPFSYVAENHLQQYLIGEFYQKDFYVPVVKMVGEEDDVFVNDGYFPKHN